MSNKRHFLLPTNLNRDPYLTMWWMEDNTPTTFFVQMSEDEGSPCWIKCGDILELLCRKEMNDDNEFTESIIRALKYKEYGPFLDHIKKLIY